MQQFQAFMKLADQKGLILIVRALPISNTLLNYVSHHLNACASYIISLIKFLRTYIKNNLILY